MYELILENAKGNQLTFGANSPYTITEIQGLNPPEATINTSQMALIDGGKYTSGKVEMRQINIAFAIEYAAAANRRAMYNVLRSKQYIKVLYKDDYLDVFIEGYVQSIDPAYFEMKQIVTVSILCPQPYLQAAQQIVDRLSSIINAFHFPFASTAAPQIVFGYYSTDIGIVVDNEGDVECGMIIVLVARDSVTNPKIYNYITQDFFGLNYTMQARDQITIDTRKGEKSVTLLRNGVESNLFNYVMEDSTWLQLSPDGDTFAYEVGTGEITDLNVTFKHTDLFEGV